MPTGVNAYCLIINKSLMDKLGIPSDIKWDWDTIYEEGKKLHEKDSSKYLLLADHGILAIDFTNMLKQRTGKEWIDDHYTLGFTQEEAAEALAWIDKALKAGVYQPLGESDLFFGKGEQNPKWINQEIPMTFAMSSLYITQTSVLPQGTETITALPVIAKDAKDTSVLVRPSQLLAISKSTKHPEEAAKFMNWFLNDPEAALILGDVRSIPASKPSQEAAVKAGKINAEISNAVELGLANAGIVDNEIATNSEIDAILQEIIEKVSYGKASPEDASKELIEKLNAKLKELQGRN